MIAWAIVSCASPPCGVEAGPSCAESTSTEPTPEPEDTAVDLGDIEVLAKVEDCAGPEWWYAFDLSDVPADAELTVTGILADGARADEVHALEVSAASHWQANGHLVVVDDATSQLAGVTTRFGCDRVDAMTWRLFTWDGSDRRSCLLWGAEPAMLEAEGCARW